jgi:hypothetical protein
MKKHSGTSHFSFQPITAEPRSLVNIARKARASFKSKFGRTSARRRPQVRLSFPIEVRTDISASPAAGLAGEARFDVGQPNLVGPSVGADRDPMAALEIGAIDQQAANAGGAHFSQGDLLAGEFRHGPSLFQLVWFWRAGRRLSLPRLPGDLWQVSAGQDGQEAGCHSPIKAHPAPVGKVPTVLLTIWACVPKFNPCVMFPRLCYS